MNRTLCVFAFAWVLMAVMGLRAAGRSEGQREVQVGAAESGGGSRHQHQGMLDRNSAARYPE